jgi:two-component system sensor histidine kinase/response regulator
MQEPAAIDKLLALINHLPAAVYHCIIHEDTLMLDFMSDGFSDLTGYPVEDVTAQNVDAYRRVVYPDDREQLTLTIQQSLQARKDFTVVYRIIHQNGHLKWVRENGRIYSDASGVAHLLGYVFDITTEQLAAELIEANRQELDLLSRVARNTSDSIIIADTFGVIVWVNEAFERISGYAKSSIIGKRLGYSLEEQSASLEVKQQLETAIVQAKPFQTETQSITASGNKIWLEVAMQPLWDEAQQHLGFLLVENDITDRKQAEAELAEQEARYRMLFSNSIDGILLLSEQLEVSDANEAACKLLQYHTGTLVGMQLAEIIDIKDERFRFFTEELEDDGKARAELYFIGADGKAIEVDLTASKFYDSDATLHYVYIFRDITARKQEQVKMEQLLRRLSLATGSSGTGIWEVDVQTGAIVWDDMMYVLFGYPSYSPTAAFSIWKQAMHPEDASLMMKVIGDLVSGEKEVDKASFRIIRPDGEIRYLDSNAIVQHDAKGHVQKLIGTVRDVTESVASAHKIKQQYKALREIAFAQSHEVRRHAANIISVIELLQLDPASLKDADMIQMLQHSATEMDKQIKLVVNKINQMEKDQSG